MTRGAAPSAKGLFRATRPKSDPGAVLPMDLPKKTPAAVRDPLDYDPTPEDATEAFLRVELPFIRAHGRLVSEPAIGGGHIARVLRRHGFTVRGHDVVDRDPGCVFCLGDFRDADMRPALIQITNPPYNLVNARDGGGLWLWHSFALGFDYIALLLNADWAAARINGMDKLFHLHPPSVEYLCCWKIVFRGGGSPPQRNSWFVWDTRRPALGPSEWRRVRLYRDGPPLAQGVLV